MMRALLPAAAALATLMIACGDNGSDPSDASQTAIVTPATAGACTPARPAPPGDFGETPLSGGIERTYFVHVPPVYSGADPVPVVLGFPAGGMTAEAFAAMTELLSVSDAAGFLLMVVTAVDGRWNQGDGSAGTDLAFVMEALDSLTERYCVDASRVFVAGYSTGGGMAQSVTCAMPERIAALAVVASTYQACRAPVPMVAFHGIDDSLAPFEGGVPPPPATQAVSFPSVRRAISEWARVLGCDGLATISRPSSEVELSRYRRCLRGDGQALLYSVVGGGHTWPGSPANIDALGFTTQQLDASQVIWQFFAAHPKAR